MFLVRNLKQIATPVGRAGVRGAAMRELAVFDDAVIVVDGERFAYAGREREMPPEIRAAISRDLDARGATAIPGFVDSHTHIPFSGYRESEFNRRLRGETYEQIAASGGGIASTVRSTRAATEGELVENVLARTVTMARHGTTTAEAKSGYGLTFEDELKQLRAVRAAAARSPVRLVPTCLAAHEFPPERRGSESERQAWVDEIVESIVPAVARERLAVFCD
ncbi:MAG TPA: amidohydrolase family protein, partial [Thermoanaerobaculia bacterium]|nr:amidohydrolase family protein [Thermoanaerobaculia bacterium]